MAAQPLDALEGEGALRIEGDRALAERFVTLFPASAQGRARRLTRRVGLLRIAH